MNCPFCEFPAYRTAVETALSEPVLPGTVQTVTHSWWCMPPEGCGARWTTAVECRVVEGPREKGERDGDADT